MTVKLRILRPTAEPADRAVLVGDPGRALLLASELLMTPAPMFNHHRGLWGYSGPAADGSGTLMVQGTGIGGPSINAVVADLVQLGVKRVVRLGTCASSNLALGSQVVASSATKADSRQSFPDALLCDAGAAALTAATVGPVASADVHLDPGKGSIPEGACAADLSTASLYEAALQLGLAAISILVVTETPEGMASDEAVEAAMKAIAPPSARLLA